MSSGRELDLRIEREAQQHHGAIRRGTLAALGVSADAISARLDDHRLLRTATRGVYAVAVLVDAWTPFVVALARSDYLAVSQEWAAAAYRWDGFDRGAQTTPTLVCPWTSRPDLRAARRRDLTTGDLRMIHGVRVPQAAWTLATLSESRHVTADRLEWAVESALREGHVTRHGLSACLDRLGTKPAPQALRAVLDRRGPDTPATGSLLETLTVQRVSRGHSIAVVARQVDGTSGTDFWVARTSCSRLGRCWRSTDPSTLTSTMPVPTGHATCACGVWASRSSGAATPISTPTGCWRPG